MQKPELSIIIISYNTAKITVDAIKSIIESLDKSQLNYEIIVIDNNSSDGSVDALEKIKNQISKIKNTNQILKIIKNKENKGFGRANNQAVAEAQGKYILLLNSDIVVLDNAIKKLLDFYKHNDNQIHFLGGKLFNKDMTPQPSCGPFYTLPVIFAALFLKGDYWGLTRYSPNNLKKIDWVSGACILTKKEYYKKIGGFDEEIFMYMEEIDLLYRAKLKKYQTYFYPQAPFIHLGFASSGSKSAPIINVYRGFLYLYKKHFPGLSLFFLKILLKLKARVAIFIGKITQNSYLCLLYTSPSPRDS